MKAVIYSRISKEDQSEYSLSEQVATCKDYIEKEKYELIDIYLDDGYSAKNMKRPQLQQLLTDLKNRKFNMIVIWRLDRLTRDTLDGLNMVRNDFKPYGVEFASVTEDIDTSTPDGMMMYTIRLSMAQNEREKIAERSAMGQIGRAKRGLRNTPVKPLGYGVNPDDLSLYIIEEEAVIVRKMFEWFAGGIGKNKIARLLNTEGIDGESIPSPRGNLWDDTAVTHILSNLTYTGAVHWKRKGAPESDRIIVDGAHEAIISETLFETVQNIIKRRREESLSSSSYDFPFSTIVKCGECGRSYHGQQAERPDRKNKFMRYYRCSGRTKNKGCQASFISELKLAALFFTFIENFSITSDETDKVLGSKDIEKEKKRLQKLIDESTNKRKNYARAMGSGKLDYDMFEDLMDEENKKFQKFSHELEEIMKLMPQSKRTRKDVVDLVSRAKNEWGGMTLLQRKDIVQQLFAAIVIQKRDGEWSIIAAKLAE